MKLITVGLLGLALAFALGFARVAPGAAPTQGRQAPGLVDPVLVAVDSSGRGNDGVNQGRPITGLPGHRGTSYSFDRPGSWIQVPSAASLNPGPRDFWLTAWVNLAGSPALGDTYDIVRKGLAYTAQGEYKMEIVPGGYVRCTAKDDRRRVAVLTDHEHSVTDGRWHRIGCARSGDTWNVIVGRSVTSEPVTLGSVANTMPLSIGSKYGMDDLPSGRVDEVALWIASGRKHVSLPPPLSWPEQPAAYPAAALWHLDERPGRLTRRSAD